MLAAIVGYLRATKAPARATQQVLGGAGVAILASFAVWLLAQQVLTITPANRELVSGVIALIAAVVLVSVTNWLLHKVYVVDWVSFVKQQVQQAMGRSSVLGLALLGFMIVFREGFETVLFFQALLADSPPWAVAVGAALGCALIGAVAWAVLKLGVKLPLKPFFTVTSLLLLVMAVSFVGNGVRNLQEAGLVSVTRLEGIPLGLVPSLLGLFPTYETVMAQLLLLIVVGADVRAFALSSGAQTGGCGRAVTRGGTDRSAEGGGAPGCCGRRAARAETGACHRAMRLYLPEPTPRPRG